MALPTQKVIIMIIVLNLAIGWAMDIYYNPTLISGITDNPFYEETQQGKESEINIQEEESGLWGSVKSVAGDIADITIGGIKWLYQLIRILVLGILPLTLQGIQFNHIIERMIIYGIDFFRTIVWFGIIIVELIMITRNKKAT